MFIGHVPVGAVIPGFGVVTEVMDLPYTTPEGHTVSGIQLVVVPSDGPHILIHAESTVEVDVD